MDTREKYDFEIKLPAILPSCKTGHFNIYYYPNSLAEKEMDKIITLREKAYKNISNYLNTDLEIKIDLYLFNDAETKEAETGHRGEGWAFDTVMVELYTENRKCHPYHELVHVFADKIYGESVSFFSEGLAVFISGTLLNEEFKDGDINCGMREKAMNFYKQNDLFPLREMFSFEISGGISKPRISYPEAGCVIKYLYEKLGKEKFFDLYKSLKADYTADGQKANIQIVEKHCSKTIEQLNDEWLNSLIESRLPAS